MLQKVRERSKKCVKKGKKADVYSKINKMERNIIKIAFFYLKYA